MRTDGTACYFKAHGGVRAHWWALREQDAKLYSIRSTGLVPLQWEQVGGPFVEIKVLELALDFTKDRAKPVTQIDL